MDFRTLTMSLCRVGELMSPHWEYAEPAALGPGAQSVPFVPVAFLIPMLPSRVWSTGTFCSGHGTHSMVGIVCVVQEASHRAEAKPVCKGACLGSLQHHRPPPPSSLLPWTPPPDALSFCIFYCLSIFSLCPFPCLPLFLSFFLSLCLLVKICYLSGCLFIYPNLSLNPCLVFPCYFLPFAFLSLPLSFSFLSLSLSLSSLIV